MLLVKRSLKMFVGLSLPAAAVALVSSIASAQIGPTAVTAVASNKRIDDVGHNGRTAQNAGHNGAKGKNAGHNGVDAAEDHALKPKSAIEDARAHSDRRPQNAGHSGGKGKDAGHNGAKSSH